MTRGLAPVLGMAKLLTSIAGAALAMAAWSEFVFFNEGPGETLARTYVHSVSATLGYTFEIGLFYAIPGACLVGLMSLFGTVGSRRVLLLGAFTGYVIEGAVVNAVYEAVPFSFLWTSVAWHGPITVALGVFLLPRVLATASVTAAVGTTAALGVGWGVWMTWTWGAPDLTPVSPAEFLRFAVTTTLIMGVAYALLSMSDWPRIALPRWLAMCLIAPSLFLFVIQAIGFPLHAIGLFVILAALIWALAGQGKAYSSGYPLKLSHLTALVLLPVTASCTYYLVNRSGSHFGSEDLTALTMVCGLVVWLWGVFRRQGGRNLSKHDAPKA